MALIKIDDVFLYTGLSETATDSYNAKKWIDEQGIKYEFMHYGDEIQHAELFAALSTWWPDQPAITAFPFIVYTEIHDDLSPRNYPKVCIRGLAAIQESTLPQLYKLGRS